MMDYHWGRSSAVCISLFLNHLNCAYFYKFSFRIRIFIIVWTPLWQFAAKLFDISLKSSKSHDLTFFWIHNHYKRMHEHTIYTFGVSSYKFFWKWNYQNFAPNWNFNCISWAYLVRLSPLLKQVIVELYSIESDYLNWIF